VDLLDFEAQGLYFDEPEVAGVHEMIADAAENYAQGDAELPLLKAYFLAPESLNVLVALNRFYYYQHRLDDALTATTKALAVIRPLVNFPENWRDLQLEHITQAPANLLTQVRLYLFTLKAVGFLHMRLENLDLSEAIFTKLLELDSKNRIGAEGLLELVLKRKAEAGEAQTV
jgi:tetratricopeptide (TPR) repeat protein